MSLVKTKNEDLNFPLEVFGEDIKQSFLELANEFSVPINFFWMYSTFYDCQFIRKYVPN